LRLVCEEEGITTELSGIQLGVCYSPMLAKGFPQSSVGTFWEIFVVVNCVPCGYYAVNDLALRHIMFFCCYFCI